MALATMGQGPLYYPENANTGAAGGMTRLGCRLGRGLDVLRKSSRGLFPLLVKPDFLDRVKAAATRAPQQVVMNAFPPGGRAS
jgi:hypothetical protein